MVINRFVMWLENLFYLILGNILKCIKETFQCDDIE
jgi:hypothetical protein